MGLAWAWVGWAGRSSGPSGPEHFEPAENKESMREGKAPDNQQQKEREREHQPNTNQKAKRLRAFSNKHDTASPKTTKNTHRTTEPQIGPNHCFSYFLLQFMKI
jgi:hypothetical protein